MCRTIIFASVKKNTQWISNFPEKINIFEFEIYLVKMKCFKSKFKANFAISRKFVNFSWNQNKYCDLSRICEFFFVKILWLISKIKTNIAFWREFVIFSWNQFGYVVKSKQTLRFHDFSKDNYFLTYLTHANENCNRCNNIKCQFRQGCHFDGSLLEPFIFACNQYKKYNQWYDD